MELAIKVFILAAMIRFLIATDKPLLCAAIYAGSVFLIGAVFDQELMRVTMMAGLAFVAAFVYFWTLDRLDTGSFIWWVIAICGMPLVLL